MKLIKYLFISIFIISFNINSVFAETFADVNEDYIYYEAIEFAAKEKIVNGRLDKEANKIIFDPEVSITRGELVKMVIGYKFSQIEIDECKNGIENINFSDVPNENTHSAYICKAKLNGIVHGYKNNFFKPNESVTVFEAVKIISNTFGLTEGNSTIEENKFKMYFDALALKNAIPKTVILNPFRIERGEVMEILYRLVKSNEDRSSISYEEFNTILSTQNQQYDLDIINDSYWVYSLYNLNRDESTKGAPSADALKSSGYFSTPQDDLDYVKIGNFVNYEENSGKVVEIDIKEKGYNVNFVTLDLLDQNAHVQYSVDLSATIDKVYFPVNPEIQYFRFSNYKGGGSGTFVYFKLNIKDCEYCETIENLIQKSNN